MAVKPRKVPHSIFMNVQLSKLPRRCYNFLPFSKIRFLTIIIKRTARGKVNLIYIRITIDETLSPMSYEKRLRAKDI